MSDVEGDTQTAIILQILMNDPPFDETIMPILLDKEYYEVLKNHLN